jgi:GNAT superfamily N-acetyltransferase
MKVNLRSAQVADASRLAEIYLASRKRYISYAPLAHTDAEILMWIQHTLIPDGGVTVAILDSTLVGFLAVSQGDRFRWIDHLYLDPSLVGAGIGSSLVELAKIQLHPPIRLYTFQQNDGARRFYRRHGFREIELTDGSSNEERTPDVLMEWP